MPSGRLFAVGGCVKGEPETNAVEMLEYSWMEEKPPHNRVWRHAAPLLHSRRLHGLAFIDGKLVAAGGSKTMSVEVFTLPSPGDSEGQWTEVRPFTSEKNFKGMMPFDGGLLAVGKRPVS